MKLFISRTLIFLLILLVIDRSFIIFRFDEINLFTDISRDKMLKIKPLIKEINNFDLFVLGSSHVQFGVSPEILSNQTSLKAINLAYGRGSNIGAQLALLTNFIEKRNAVPKVVALGIDVFTLNREPVSKDEFQDILLSKSSSTFQWQDSKYSKSYINLYSRFISRYIVDIQKGKITPPYFRNNTTYDLAMFKEYNGYSVSDLGWVQGNGVLNPTYVRYNKLNFDPNPKSIPDLKFFVKLCNKYKIKLILFQTPENIECLKFSKKYTDFDVFMKRFCEETNTNYVNFNNLKSFPIGDNDLFFDSDHLNTNGAEKFSLLLADKINKLKAH